MLGLAAYGGYETYRKSQQAPKPAPVLPPAAIESDYTDELKKKKNSTFGTAQREEDLGVLSLAQGGKLGDYKKTENLFG
jgi:hypothetical protein